MWTIRRRVTLHVKAERAGSEYSRRADGVKTMIIHEVRRWASDHLCEGEIWSHGRVNICYYIFAPKQKEEIMPGIYVSPIGVTARDPSYPAMDTLTMSKTMLRW
jgi:hypothetical protein